MERISSTIARERSTKPRLTGMFKKPLVVKGPASARGQMFKLCDESALCFHKLHCSLQHCPAEGTAPSGRPSTQAEARAAMKRPWPGQPVVVAPRPRRARPTAAATPTTAAGDAGGGGGDADGHATAAGGPSPAPPPPPPGGGHLVLPGRRRGGREHLILPGHPAAAGQGDLVLPGRPAAAGQGDLVLPGPPQGGAATVDVLPGNHTPLPLVKLKPI